MRSLVSYGFLAPPNLFIVLCLLGAVIALVWRRRAGTVVVLASSICLFAAAMPAVSSYLTLCLESQIPKGADLSGAQAIVVLAADFRSGHGAIPDRLGLQSLERLVLTADAHHQLHLPVAVSGGRVADLQTSLAELMKAALTQYFAVPVTWSENRSRTTYENAAYTAQLLRDANIGTVVLITQARDMPRAIWSFERVGLRALPWPEPRTVLRVDRIEDFLPSTGALDDSFYAMHELIGTFYYRLYYKDH
jgi:uncharacterized SAM-binding protein YcdF (DUF218 family)